jgi:hypothetical protein
VFKAQFINRNACTVAVSILVFLELVFKATTVTPSNQHN